MAEHGSRTKIGFPYDRVQPFHLVASFQQLPYASEDQGELQKGRSQFQCVLLVQPKDVSMQQAILNKKQQLDRPHKQIRVRSAWMHMHRTHKAC